MTCVVDGPRLASTPVKTMKHTGSSLSMNLSPQQINYSETDNLSSIPSTQQCQGENPAVIPNLKDLNSTLDQLEDALSSTLVSKIFNSFFNISTQPVAT